MTTYSGSTLVQSRLVGLSTSGVTDITQSAKQRETRYTIEETLQRFQDQPKV